MFYEKFYMLNSKSLIVTNTEYLKNTLSEIAGCNVVCISAWQKKINNLDEVICYLLEYGIKYFVCIGTFSEFLHDDIDEIIYQYFNYKQDIDVITTYHDSKEIDEGINFFLYTAGTENENTIQKNLLAILDDNDIVLDELKKSIDMSHHRVSCNMIDKK